MRSVADAFWLRFSVVVEPAKVGDVFADPALFTVNPLLVPAAAPPVLVAVIVLLDPACVTVTLSVRTPLANVPDVVGVMVPAVVAKSTVFPVPSKLVTVLLFASCAVIVILKAVPAV